MLKTPVFTFEESTVEVIRSCVPAIKQPWENAIRCAFGVGIGITARVQDGMLRTQLSPPPWIVRRKTNTLFHWVDYINQVHDWEAHAVMG